MYNESAVAASLCRRTPNHCSGVGVCFVTVFTVGEACGGGSVFTDGDAFGVGDSRDTLAFLLGLAEGLGSAPKLPLILAGGSWPLLFEFSLAFAFSLTPRGDGDVEGDGWA